MNMSTIKKYGLTKYCRLEGYIYQNIYTVKRNKGDGDTVGMLCNGSTSRNPFYCHWTLSAFPSRWPRGWRETPQKEKFQKLATKINERKRQMYWW